MQTKAASPPPNRGWWVPVFATAKHKWHYYDERGKSLCGKYVKFLGHFIEEADDPKFDDSDDNCVVCRRKLAKLRGTDEDT